MSEEERQQYRWCNLWARAVGWEVWALANVVHGLALDDLTLIEEMALVEAALTHTRCLAEFLVGRDGKRKTARPGWDDRDLSPLDALPDWAPDPQAVTSLRETLKRIDEQTAHVTMQRLPLVSTSWDLEALRDQILGLLGQFVEALRTAESPYCAHLESWLVAAGRPWEMQRRPRADRAKLAALPRRLAFTAMGTPEGAHAAVMAPVLDDPSAIQKPDWL